MLPSELKRVMRQMLEQFQHLHRLSGSPDAERSVDILCETLPARQIPVKRERCALYLSDPLAASVTLADETEWRIAAKTRSFSANCPQGVEAKLVYDARSLAFIAENAFPAWAAEVHGKIVVADQGYEEYVQRLMRAGALGLIHIWGSAEQALHEETVGPIWGTPVPDDRLRYPTLPVAAINQQQGKMLLQRMHQATQTARLTTEVREHVAACSLPVVEIAGESEEFILLSSHYDSWHEGVTDNATGNALCLAMAIFFAQQKQPLKRGLRIAWWPGHSNARYGGSTWYADRYRAELMKHCAAHINVDSPGCRDGSELVINASGAESVAFLNQALLSETGRPASRITPLGKGGDQSFWGTDIPLHFALREEPEVRTSLSPGSGGGWWWHTEEDTLDKVDEANLWRAANIHGRWLNRLLFEEDLPLDTVHYLASLRDALIQLQGELDPAFDLQQLILKLTELEKALRRERIATEQLERIVGLLHRARYRASDDYHPDLSYHGGAFPGLQLLRGHRREQSDNLCWVMLETQYYRQRDRALELLEKCLLLTAENASL
ncbi:M28 family peptidase [Pantoea sp.]|uniref:M28 family peptidase n=1 Tax=Pantoea sp. TaxID=69393 RepID=UPI00289F17BC|nr:M28 family peptidase [Pantoea sp.]